MRIGTWITVGAVTFGLATAAWAITGKNGWTATTATTASAIKANSTYVSGFGGTHWQDLASLAFYTPARHDGVAADASGNLYAIVRGDTGSTSGPMYTGLVRISGSTITTLVQDTMSSFNVVQRTGTELLRVVVSPSDVGNLTSGHPVLLRWTDLIAGNSSTAGSAEIVSVDPGTGAETLIYEFADLPHYLAGFAIDGSGTATDGTIYVNDGDGAIVRLTYSAGAWVADTVPGGFVAGAGLRVGPDGSLYTSSVANPWGWFGYALASPTSNHPIYRVNPSTGQSSVWGYVDGKSYIYSWGFDAGGTLWLGLVDTSKGNKNPNYVTRGVAGGVTSVGNRISESAKAPWCVAAGAGAVYVLDDVTAVYALR